MKKMGFISFIIAFDILVGLGNPAKVLAGDGLKIKIKTWPTQKVFLVKEPIWLKVTVWNKSTLPQKVGELDLGLRIPEVFLLDSQGNRLNNVGLKGDKLPVGETLILSPSDSFVKYIPLFYYFGVPGKVRALISGGPLVFPPGNYWLFIRTQGKGGDYWESQITSDTVNFEVKYPIGDEGKALEELYDCMRFANEYHLKGKTIEDLAMKYREVLRKYPKTVYGVLLQADLSAFFSPGVRPSLPREILSRYDEQDLLETKLLIEKYPDSPFAAENVSKLLKSYKILGRVQDGNEFIKLLASEKPNTLSGKEATKVLKTIK